jgi:HAE1 family hydrophobic/amphiphilic exporter-1
VLITAFTTIIGVLPMVFSRTQGAEIRSPIGISIACGLFVATFFTLFIVPIIYSIVNRIKFAFHHI